MGSSSSILWWGFLPQYFLVWSSPSIARPPVLLTLGLGRRPGLKPLDDPNNFQLSQWLASVTFETLIRRLPLLSTAPTHLILEGIGKLASLNIYFSSVTFIDKLLTTHKERVSIKKAMLNQYLACLAVKFLAPTYWIIFFFSPKIALRWPAPDTVDRVDNLDTRLMVGQLTYWASQLGLGLAAQTINATPQKTSLKVWLKYLRQDQMLANPKCNPASCCCRTTGKVGKCSLGF